MQSIELSGRESQNFQVSTSITMQQRYIMPCHTGLTGEEKITGE